MEIDSPARELRRLLDAYDHANRLAIDALYAQFSPTLDDFYAEELLIVFPARAGSASSELHPDLILTRTVPGQAPKSVRSTGAPFPLATAERLALAALDGLPGAAAAALQRLQRGNAYASPRQVPRTQQVVLRIEPDGPIVLDLVQPGM